VEMIISPRQNRLRAVLDVHQRGFTLIELMITVAIVAILAAVAYPSYVQYVQRSHRADAGAALASAAQWMERQYTTNNVYPTAVTGSGTSKYAVSVLVSTNTSFTLQAAPIAPWTDADCGALRLTNVGDKAIYGGTSTAAKCWGR
jgi:type IV pilus assembly protein PilE